MSLRIVLPGGLVNVPAPGAGSGDALVANPLSQFATTTSAQLAAVVSNETGTGSLVFAGSPTFTGVPVAPTAAAGTNTTQLATTAHVFAERANASTLTNKTIESSSNSITGITNENIANNAAIEESKLSLTDTAQSINDAFNRTYNFTDIQGTIAINQLPSDTTATLPDPNADSLYAWDDATGLPKLWPTGNGIGFSGTSPSKTLGITGPILLKSYTVATLPAAGTVGRMACVTDATSPTYNGTLTGGGTVKVIVLDNGTEWKAH